MVPSFSTPGVRGLFLLLVLQGAAWPPKTGGAKPLSDEVKVQMSAQPEGIHRVEGAFRIAASSGTVWSVLSDYDHLSDFVSSIRSSRVLPRHPENRLVEQRMKGRVGIFRKTVYVLLDISEVAGSRIDFDDVSHRSFRVYRGAWTIFDRGDAIEVRYDLRARPRFFAPDFLANDAFEQTVKNLLTEVRTEIERRQRIQ